MPAKLTASLARQNFSDILSRAEYRGERVIVHRGKKAVAAVVPIEDRDTPETLSERILREEHRIYSDAVRLILSGRYRIEGRRVIALPNQR